MQQLQANIKSVSEVSIQVSRKCDTFLPVSYFNINVLFLAYLHWLPDRCMMMCVADYT